MRTLLGTTAPAIARRGVALERAAMITLRRDAYADSPGPSLSLAIGERTTYRPGAWLLDTFERDALGDAYPAWGGTAGLVLDAGRAVPAALVVHQMASHTRALPRDQWVGLIIDALAGSGAEVGVLLRASADAVEGIRVRATPTATIVQRAEAGGFPSSLAIEATPWRAGDQLRVEVVWDRLRVYRDMICIVDVTHDPALALTGRQVGLTALRTTAGDAAAIGAWFGGAARQEWLGAGLDLGDVQRTLGRPAAFELTLSNQAPMGGADRFAALLRHGLNTEGTYDLDRGEVRVLTVIDGTPAPLTAGIGLLDGPAEVTEDVVRLACHGRDAFLTPQLAAGVVTYLPGPPPAGLTPLPEDPCAPSDPPVIEPGPVPPEPPPPTNPARDEGAGPEAPPIGQSEGDGGLGEALTLPGTWLVRWDYTLTDGLYVGSTTVTPSPDAAHAAAGYTDHDFVRPQVQLLAGMLATPEHILETWVYRGPDIGGTHLVPNTHYPPPGGSLHQESGPYVDRAGGPSAGVVVRLAQYEAHGIHTEADLAALRPPNPGETPSPLPARIETLREWTTSGTSTFETVVDPLIPTHRFAGPQLLRLEIDTLGPVVSLETYFWTDVPTVPVGLYTSSDVDGTNLGMTFGA